MSTGLVDLDAEHMDMAAGWAAIQLSRYQKAVLTLTPGDGTAYRLLLVGPSRVWEQGEESDRACYWVTLLGPFGHGAEWTPGGYVHWTYAAEQWVAKTVGASREHTAKVLAGFLNTLDERLDGPCVHSPGEVIDIDVDGFAVRCKHCGVEYVQSPDGAVIPVGETP